MRPSPRHLVAAAVAVGVLSQSACCVLVVEGTATNGGNPFNATGSSTGSTGDSGFRGANASCRVAPVDAGVGQLVTFDGNGSQPSAGAGAVVSWSWDFGDGVLAVGPLVSHAYPDSGLFIATLQIVDDGHVGGQATCPPVTVH